MNVKAGKPTGLVAATFTPLSEQGEINLSQIKPYVAYLIEKQSVKRVFVNGTTGEGMSLSVKERKALAEEWCHQGNNRLEQVIVHVGCMSLKDSQELARHAVTTGAHGIAVISPSFLKPSSVDSLKLYLKEVAMAAPSLPFYYYHLPAVTGVNLAARDVLEGIEKQIPSFRGVKFSGTDLLDLGLCVSYCPAHWSVLYGVDEQLLGGLAMGACGAVGSTYNYIGLINNKMLALFEGGDLTTAREIEELADMIKTGVVFYDAGFSLQFKIQAVMSDLFKLGFDLPMNKQLMSEVSGINLGPPRLPLQPCDPLPIATSALSLQRLHHILDSSSGQKS
ncbi:N-acetylneuraminate lyase isoform X1 [Osmerus eperlanus]|uniref:N-acetylneuraminate lyase isoform X1 n=1 Tax=Osmerus eperlanus TaxID=29151 RepID=UPI002E107DD5